MPRAIFLAALLLLTLGRAAPIGAAEPEERVRQEAATRFERGVKLFEAGDFSAALAEFEAIYRLTGRYEVLYNVGVTQKKLFRYGDAVRTLERYLADGGARIPPARRSEVESELAEVRALVAEVIVKVPGPPAQVEVDGRDVGTTPLAHPILVGPGKHALKASRAGEVPAEKMIDVVSGARVEVELAPSPPEKIVTTAKLTVSSKPPGARLSIDGQNVGIEPWSGELEAGGHEVVGHLEGYAKARQEVVMVSGQSRQLVLELVAIPPPVKPAARRWYQKWYVWTAVSVAVVGGATLGYFVTRPEEIDVVIYHQ
ncbi:MAG: PEGA domain-containing protein [Deltaproteobacteria bacterium]|nr:PEGA domain-containing protein [Deltaproteobacteria bacterium]